MGWLIDKSSTFIFSLDILIVFCIQGAAGKSEHFYINKVFRFSRRTVYLYNHELERQEVSETGENRLYFP